MFEDVQPVGISTRAIEEVKKIMETKSIPAEYGLRLGVRGGGCNGLTLIIGFDKRKTTDLSYVIEGVPIYLEKKHAMYLIGKEVDYYEGAEAKGFMFVDAPKKS